jgi:hypothetical protein
MTATPSTRIAVGPCGNCGYGIALTTTTKTTCPSCHTRVTLRWVQGTYNKQTPCDAACQYAHSPWCSCSCGGTNHGAGYIDVDMVPEWVRQRDADRQDAKTAKAAKRLQSAKDKAAAAAAAQLAAHPELQTLVDSDEYPDGFMGDMRRELRYGRPLTDRQVAAAVRIVAEDIATAPARAAAAAAEAQKLADAAAAEQARRSQPGALCPTGRVAFTGTITTTRVDETVHGVHWAALVTTDAGWQVWVTLPAAVMRANPASNYPADRFAHQASFRGRRVEMVATVTPKTTDPTVGSGTHPKGTLVPDLQEVAA